MRVAFIKNSGLCAGGIEKYLQQIAVELVKTGVTVDFFYTDAVPCGSNRIMQPGTDPGRRSFMEAAGVNLVETSCSYFDTLETGGKWYDTDLFDVFDPQKYQVVIGGHKGEPNWPFSEIKGPKILETVHGTDFTSGASQYSDAYVLISEYQKDRWLKAGGDIKKTHVIAPMVMIKRSPEKCERSKWDIPRDKFIFGMHQAPRRGLFSSVPLDAYLSIQSENNFFAMLGGTEEHSNYAKQIGVKNFLRIPAVSSSGEVNSFLSCLDVYSHGRSDGEVCSSAIIEAMANSLPIITHPSNINNGHITQIEGCGFIAKSPKEYTQYMATLESIKEVRNLSSIATKAKYEERFEFVQCRAMLLKLIRQLGETNE